MATIKKSKKRFIIPICILLVIAIVGGASAGVIAKSKKNVVQLYTVSTGDISEDVTLTGSVSSGSVKEYKVGTVATIKEVFVEVGDEVKEGDVLATFDVTELDSQIATLQASYDASLQNYNTAVATKENAEKAVAALDEEIAELEERIAELEDEDYEPETYTRETSGYTRPTQAPTTTKAPRTTTTTTSATESTSETQNSGGSSTPSVPNLNTIADALEELNETLVSISEDLDTIADMSALISDTIAAAIADGELDSETIASLVGDAIAKAIIEGMLDSAEMMIESGTAVDMIEAAISQIDFEGIARGVADSQNVALTAAQLQLTSLQAQRGIFSVQANGSLLQAQKTALNSTKLALDTLKDQKAEMDGGWKAAFDGTITKVDIEPNSQTTLLAAGITLENLDNMTATISLSEYDVHKVRKGMNATIKTAYGLYDGEVISIAPTATGGGNSSVLDNVGSQMGISGLSSLTAQGAGVECKVAIFSPDANIIPGFDAEVQIKTGEFNDVPVIPIESIVLEKEGSYVYVYNEEDGTATKTAIETGSVSDAYYEVKSGVSIGDRIIAIPSTDYKDETFKINVD